jgi:hypothetical protein
VTQEELHQLVADIAAGKVFGSWMLPEEHLDELLPVVFMPLALGAASKLPDDLWGVYEYTEKSGRHRTKCGKPIFMTMKILRSEEGQEVARKLRALGDLMEQFKKAE